MSGHHYVILDQVDVCGGDSTCYQDETDLEQFEAYDVDTPFGYNWFSNDMEPTSAEDSYVPLGDTYDVATLTTPAACGDVRDQIIKEYSTFMVALQPTCSTFIETLSGSFSLATLTPDETSTYKPWAIIHTYMPPNLSTMQTSSGITLSISSGYRNPSAEVAAAAANHVKAAKNSRHQYGDAVDLRTGNSQQTFSNLLKAAHATKECVEPQSLSGIAHVHVDWRDLYSSPANGASPACPPLW